jgi:hypothetical protein
MPYQLNEEQIAFILDDIKKRGINIEDLQLSLLDHICCLIEKELQEGENFESFYRENIKRFFTESLSEIEDETKSLLKNRNFYKFRYALYTLLFLSLSYNAIFIARSAASYMKFRERRQLSEELKTINFKDGIEDFNLKLKKEYPQFPNKDYTCIAFGSPPGFWLREEITPTREDSQIVNYSKTFRKKFYYQMDSIAGIYRSKINMIIAFQGKREAVDLEIKELRPFLTNSYFLKDQSKLFAGYANYKKMIGSAYPTIFMIDKNDKIVKDFPIFGYRPIILCSYLNKLKNN